ncbi:hypothetical protein GRF29_69g2168713 [Pseudopithomyces chartarum]|uniref:Phospholipase D/nuclease n=1 Tax=Pseudopithomyces chartarum TaxID=1892770 RepID=A0AAN6LYJ8_9PLEO|nr:hypothetical protein GRF29_69g2168713 [Pseudopithomyces chartarum]
MSPVGESVEPPNKRRKLKTDVTTEASSTPPPQSPGDASIAGAAAASLQRPISPPSLRKRKPRTPSSSTSQIEAEVHVTKQTSTFKGKQQNKSKGLDNTGAKISKEMRYVRSPIQLTRIKDLGSEQNVDTVTLNDLLGDPMIKECWNFNFLFDLDFVMGQFDVDVRHMVKVKIVHGFWKNEDANRIALVQSAERYPNIQLISAYMPDPFGTHHSKMLVLLRHDDTAQIIIHTANMIPRDWGNMTQAVWQSPILPLTSTPLKNENTIHPIGSGPRFKTDLLHYLHAYGNRLHALTSHLAPYDFTPIRAAFLASAPSRQKPSTATSHHTPFGWPGLQQILSTIPTSPTTTPPPLVIQVSSIATLGASPTWLTHFHSILSTTASSPSSQSKATPTALNIIFPTPHEIRTSLSGYASGSSIHTKLSSPAQQKQLQYLHPFLRHWSSPPSPSPSQSSSPTQESVHTRAHRGPAAPHIKTYILFRDASFSQIEWALLTSANLSRQAWGERRNKEGVVGVKSYEVGVCVWPGLFADGGAEAEMVPVFGGMEVVGRA